MSAGPKGAKRSIRTARRPRVVIIGAGFGGIDAVIGRKKTDVDVIVIDRRNYHLLQPLLYQVATAGLLRRQVTNLRLQAGRSVAFGLDYGRIYSGRDRSLGRRLDERM
ncbi:Pyridine nucleotide-disulphide oxidoreductase [Mesorhizobium albiziae]|uniref:NADH:ubiquinone reductase (non-electrogenic) n=1 Tax=Neomesorhizobium albiziae TaxID=335020 RepID=A0A1I4EDB5_9HYPH|nr:Pyridine nucleotide-disulphide oxidoreductase [Mesorhizobium albiziae]